MAMGFHCRRILAGFSRAGFMGRTTPGSGKGTAGFQKGVVAMKNYQIRRFFIDKGNVATPITDELIACGYVQKRGGYIDRARERGIDRPTQYWHLMESWSAASAPDATFGRSIQCGELIFWMAESSGAVSAEVLRRLKDDVLQDPGNRRRGNKLIQDACFDLIARAVEAHDAGRIG